MNYVIDANIAVAMFLDLRYSSEARSLVAGARSIIAPDVIIPETTNSLWKMVQLKRIKDDLAREVIAVIPPLFSELADGRSLAQAALDHAIRLAHPAYDCFYIALAEMRRATLLTADQRLLRRLGDLDRPVRHRFVGTAH